MYTWTDRVEYLKKALEDNPNNKTFTVGRQNLAVLIKVAEKSVEDQRNWEAINQRHKMEIYALEQKLKAAEASARHFKEKAGIRG